MLGFRLKEVPRGIASKIDTDEIEIESPFSLPIQRAWLPALKEAGFKLVKTPASLTERIWTHLTPIGERAFWPWSLELHFDPHEMGETQDEAVVGVGITGRYYPCFADWKDAHGTLSPIVFDDGLEHMKAIAKKHIAAACPLFNQAHWIVKEKHY